MVQSLAPNGTKMRLSVTNEDPFVIKSQEEVRRKTNDPLKL